MQTSYDESKEVDSENTHIPAQMTLKTATTDHPLLQWNQNPHQKRSNSKEEQHKMQNSHQPDTPKHKHSDQQHESEKI